MTKGGETNSLGWAGREQKRIGKGRLTPSLPGSKSIFIFRIFFMLYCISGEAAGEI